jgi:cytochrome oxidase Cu insertion factor (SCO1/SenC/PrrC family)
MQSITALLLALSAAAATLVAAQPAQTVDVTTLGPQVGQKALAFQLPDQQGRRQTLASVAGPKGTMLVFFRSSDW